MPVIKKEKVIFKMHETPESGNLSKVGYNKEHQYVVVHFSYGGIYMYKGVPEDVYKAFIEAESVGKFLSANIKNVYEFEKVDK
ncbi:hypothetical protein COPG_00023 [Colwellia phage 9A]|uniref:KTSC domain-containing protein n=1 Tax=Colwellia phage 9A TaxID=765765 RepID=I3UMA4_9CAUD|nr:hypothetical protein COPG_00023 [Colwellia phage 9A]AFK66619.1 hypothetical protein COPG_00023 [Colwellia phage 9A]